MKNYNETYSTAETPKTWFFLALIALLMLVLIARLFQLQVVNFHRYRSESTRNHVQRITLRAPRGDILDRNGIKLAQNHVQYDLYLATTGDFETDNKHLSVLAQLAGLDETYSKKARDILKKVSGEAPVLVKTDIPLGLVIELREKTDDFQFALIDNSSKRSYPYGELTSHVLGYLREIDEQKLRGLKDAGYTAGDLVGESGIESQYDTSLKGVPGYQLMEVNHLGHWMGLLKKWEEDDEGKWYQKPQKFPPNKGKDIQLTIDIELQKRVATEMGEHVGGVAVMDVHTGDILALYSYPTFDANLFTGLIPKVEWKEILEHPDKPLQNRMIQNAYPPGSVFKALIAIAGLMENKITRDSPVNCRGVYTVGNRDFKCWKAGGHGTVSLERGLAQSCDVYFYTVGERLGIDNIRKYGGYFGIGSPTGIDVPGEKSGFLPSPEWKQQRFKQKWFTGDTVNMSIGQGFLQLTPIQLLRLYAFVANGGKLVKPHLNMAVLTKDETPPELKQIDPRILDDVRRGLAGCVQSGTARGCYFSDLKISGKTGTADDPPRKRPHSWFVSYAPSDNPRIAMVVFGQNGGHSDEIAVPIARKIYASPEMRKYLINVPQN